ncbi:anti-sigma factor [Aurantiacibacter sp. MUD61]|uniref:anti-sigma factor n=1 Tax=Aurantiacibacter sp. MUD61 TaxID=3009083 RepID=UPI0022F03325|nr:anti-sigma factor [Aurantiacibacter sp. MUD61]
MTTEAAPDMTPRELLATEFVLGLLEGEELLRARAMLARDPEFAEEVARWEDRCAPLLDSFPPATPREEVWSRIFSATSGDVEDQSAQIVSLAKARDRWRMMTGLAMAAAAALAAVVIVGPAAEESTPIAPVTNDQPLLAANIPIGDTALRLALTYVPGRDELSVSSAGLTADGVHDHELWLVDRQGDLHSLGVIVPGEEARFAVPDGLADEFVEGSQLVLTREPLGGKPADADAGPVVAEGQFQAI